MLTNHTIQIELALDILHSQGFLWTKVKANNSKPLIVEGDMICLKTLDNDLKIGDLIATDALKLFIVQRVLKIDGDQYITKADMSDKGPFTFNKEKIIGKVILIRHNETYVNIDNIISSRINRIISILSYKRTVLFTNKRFFYRPFFTRLRRSLMKRLLRFEKFICKIDEKKIDYPLQD